jgi:hypothetical protein
MGEIANDAAIRIAKLLEKGAVAEGLLNPAGIHWPYHSTFKATNGQ